MLRTNEPTGSGTPAPAFCLGRTAAGCVRHRGLGVGNDSPEKETAAVLRHFLGERRSQGIARKLAMTAIGVDVSVG